MYLSGQHYLAISHNNLGSALEQRGMYKEAMEHYQTAIKFANHGFWWVVVRKKAHMFISYCVNVRGF